MSRCWSPTGAGYALAVGLLFGMGCDAAPGPPPLESRPPELSNLTYSPPGLLLEALPDEQVDGDTLRIPFSVEVEARDPDGQVAQVYLSIEPPQDGRPPLVAGLLERRTAVAGGARYGADFTLAIPKAEVGAYTLKLYALDDTGQLGNQVRGLLRYDATGSPPVIEDTGVPATVERPDQGAPPTVFTITATVSDPDGLANVLRVEMRVDGGEPLPLCDNGPVDAPCGAFPASGDDVAGDGVYALRVQVDASNTLGPRTLTFQAFDRAGLASEVVTRTFEIVE